jgi:hypothetical protein
MQQQMQAAAAMIQTMLNNVLNADAQAAQKAKEDQEKINKLLKGK